MCGHSSLEKAIQVSSKDSRVATGACRGGAQFEADWEIHSSAISLQHVLGEGQFGIVYKGRWNKTPVAVKVIKTNGKVHWSQAAKEVDVMRRIRHPNVVQFLGANARSGPVAIVSELLEGGSLADALRAQGGPFPLRRALEVALDCARGLNALHTARPAPIVHRDIKPDNVMMTRGQGGHRGVVGDGSRAKLADFGLSRVVCAPSTCMHCEPAAPLRMAVPAQSPKLSKPSSTSTLHVSTPAASTDTSPTSGSSMATMNTDTGTPKHAAHACRAGAAGGAGRPDTPRYSGPAGPADPDTRVHMTGGTGSYLYMAPEVFRYEAYGVKADIYSLAMVIYEMLVGQRPFARLDPPYAAYAAAHEGLRPRWHSSAPPFYTDKECVLMPEVHALVERSWASNHAKRPCCADLIVELEYLLARLRTSPARSPRCSRSSPQATPASCLYRKKHKHTSIPVPTSSQLANAVHKMTAKALAKISSQRKDDPEPERLPGTPRPQPQQPPQHMHGNAQPEIAVAPDNAQMHVRAYAAGVRTGQHHYKNELTGDEHR